MKIKNIILEYIRGSEPADPLRLLIGNTVFFTFEDHGDIIVYDRDYVSFKLADFSNVKLILNPINQYIPGWHDFYIDHFDKYYLIGKGKAVDMNKFTEYELNHPDKHIMSQLSVIEKHIRLDEKESRVYHKVG